MSITEDFVRRFADAWAAPTPSQLADLLADDVGLTHPLLPNATGKKQATRVFDRLLTLIPDLTGTVARWAGDGDYVIIHLDLAGTFAGRSIGWTTLDEIELDDGVIRSRVAHFDSLPVIAQIAGRPRGWPTALRTLVG